MFIVHISTYAHISNFVFGILAVGSSLPSLACVDSRSSRLVVVHGLSYSKPLNRNDMEKWLVQQYGCVHVPYVSGDLINDPFLQVEHRKRDLLVRHSK